METLILLLSLLFGVSVNNPVQDSQQQEVSTTSEKPKGKSSSDPVKAQGGTGTWQETDVTKKQ